MIATGGADDPKLRGKYFHARSVDKLSRICEALTGQAVLEKRETEITPLLSTIGMMLLLAAAVLSLL